MVYSEGSTYEAIITGGKSFWAYTDELASYTVIPENVTANTVTGTIVRTDGVTKLGPYYIPTVVRITATAGDLDVRNYEFTSTPVKDDDFQQVMDATGGMTPEEIGGALSATGTPIARFKSLLDSGDVRFHVYGNSIMVPNYSAPYIASMLTNGVAKVVYSSAVSGYTTSEILAKFEVDGVNEDANVVIFQEGTNDAGDGVTVAEHISNLRLFISKVLDAGAVPFLVATSPVKDKPHSALLEEMWINEILLAKSLSIPYADPWTKSTDTNGEWVASLTTDDTHPTVLAYGEAGSILSSAIQNRATDYLLPRSNDNGALGLMSGNALMITDTNADGIPDGWIANNFTNPVYTLTPSFFRGNDFTVAFSGLTNQRSLFKQATTGFSDGDRIKCSGVVGAKSLTDFRVTVYVYTTVSDNYFYGGCVASQSDGQYFEIDFIVPEGTGNLQFFAQVTPDGTGSGSVFVSSVDMYNLSSSKS